MRIRTTVLLQYRLSCFFQGGAGWKDRAPSLVIAKRRGPDDEPKTSDRDPDYKLEYETPGLWEPGTYQEPSDLLSSWKLYTCLLYGRIILEPCLYLVPYHPWVSLSTLDMLKNFGSKNASFVRGRSLSAFPVLRLTHGNQGYVQ